MTNGRIGAAVVLATVVAVLTACSTEIAGTASRGSGDFPSTAPGSAAASGSSGSPMFQPNADDARARALLLTAADLPGWTLDDSSEDDEEDDGVPDCLRFTELGRLVKANAETGFSKEPDSGDWEYVSQSVGIAVSEDEAKQAMAVAVKAYNACQTLEFTDETTGDKETGTMLPLDGMYQYGDESHAYTVRLTDTDSSTGDVSNFTVIVEAVRKGRSLMALLYTGTGTSAESFAAAISNAAGKLKP